MRGINWSAVAITCDGPVTVSDFFSGSTFHSVSVRIVGGRSFKKRSANDFGSLRVG